MATPIWSMLQQALASGSRSTVLKPLNYVLGVTMTGSIAAFHFIPEFWFSHVLAGLCTTTIIIYIIAYIYFGLTDKDALRSETFTIKKMAIQNGFVGDDKTGLIPIKTVSSQQLAISDSNEVSAKGDDQ